MNERVAANPGRFWAWVPALLLIGLIGAQLAVLGAVLEDPGFATEPDYYRKAVDWDARQARERRSQELGWSSELRVQGGVRTPRALVRVVLNDALGRALSGANVGALAFHGARASRTFPLAFQEAAPGIYHAELGESRPGGWEFRLRAVRAADVYERVFRVDLNAELERR